MLIISSMGLLTIHIMESTDNYYNEESDKTPIDITDTIEPIDWSDM